ncbi:MAG: VOC family protein [Actinobacteria bacterium]|nr:VOC family protein [Actinomycetota bacterium]MDQ3532158.1 VOC family protein [Actinomycetota bacterium]
MTSRFTELVVDCSDPGRLAEFWGAVFDYKSIKEGDNGIFIEGPEGSGPGLLFLRVPESKEAKNRLHIDVSPRDREQEEEVARILELGARTVDIGQGEQSWVVMADPEGNEFCVLRTKRP